MKILTLLLMVPILSSCYEPAYFYDGGPRRQRRIEAPKPQEPPMTVAQVKKLLEGGIGADVIVTKAEKAGVRKLSADDLVALKQAGASDELMAALIKNERAPVVVPRRAPRGRSSSYYYYYGSPRSSYYYSPYYHSGGHFGMGFSYGRSYYGGNYGGGSRFGW